jgi:hypothetical protein
MALTVKINNDGQSIPMGDTQGLLIPQDVLFCKTNRTNTITASTETKFPVNFNSGENWVDNGDIVITETGVYELSYVLVFSSASSDGLRSSFLKINNTSIDDSSCTNFAISYHWSWLNNTCIRKLNAGDRISLWFKANETSFTVSTNRGYLSATLLKKNMPYIIANKGALVSSPDSGKVSFNDDGIMTMNETVENITADFLSGWTAGALTLNAFYALKRGPLMMIQGVGCNITALTNNKLMGTITKYKPLLGIIVNTLIEGQQSIPIAITGAGEWRNYGGNRSASTQGVNFSVCYFTNE